MTDNRTPVEAYVNHSRWIAECATPSCPGAERVWPGGTLQHRKDGRPYGIAGDGVMHCANCDRTTTVIFPENRETITRLLARRPVPETRNWLPDETEEQLMVENDLNGIG